MGWVRGCKAFDRELLLVLDGKGLGLSEVAMEAELLQDSFFGDIFL